MGAARWKNGGEFELMLRTHPQKTHKIRPPQILEIWGGRIFVDFGAWTLVFFGNPAATVAHASAPHLVYFETQEGAWCGKHALNNLKEGPYVTCEACGLAARQVVQHLSQVLGESPDRTQ